MSISGQIKKRIAKNTIYLYFRMIVTTLVSLYTSRVVLNVLGIEDFGIYSVVGGFVVLFGFLRNSMTSATQRFLNYEMGKKNIEGVKKVFSTSLLIHALMSLLILLLAETLGLWFLNNQMNIEPSRMWAAGFVYQFSVFSFIAVVMSIPFTALIIAHERMSAFAYLSILTVIMKLLAAYAILYSPFDRLVYYALLMFIVSLVMRLAYSIYCRRHFSECRFVSNLVDVALLKKMFSFSSWTVFGNLSVVLHTHGVAVLLNMFFGVAINAAQGIALQVNGAVKGFVSNFLMALNPQLVQSYAASELNDMHTLINRGCRIAYCLVLFFSLPIILETPTILSIWLGKVPVYTSEFVRIILIIAQVNSFSSLLATSIGATGEIKMYQILITSIGLLHIPITWFLFDMGYQPIFAFLIYLVIAIIIQSVRIWFVCRLVSMSMLSFLKDVIGRCFVLSILVSILPFYIHINLPSSILTLFIVTCVACLTTILGILYIGLKNNERKSIYAYAKSKISYFWIAMK